MINIDIDTNRIKTLLYFVNIFIYLAIFKK